MTPPPPVCYPTRTPPQGASPVSVNGQVTRVCSNPTCRRSFFTYRSYADRRTNHFCSRKCYQAVCRAARRHCPLCGNPVTRTGTVFCNRDCSDAAQMEQMRGLAHLVATSPEAQERAVESERTRQTALGGR